MQLLTVSTGNSHSRTRAALQNLMERRIDGVIIFPEDESPETYQELLSSDLPIVFVDRPPGTLPCHLVRSDHCAGAQAGTQRLIERGHRRIAYLGDRPTLFTGTERHRGYARALEEAGIAYDARLVHMQDPEAPGVAEAFETMLALGDPPTAVFTGNSLTTLALLRSEEFNSRTTAHVAFDDLVLADVLSTPLTVVAQDTVRIGSVAAEMLQQMLGGDVPSNATVLIPTTLKVRKSDWSYDVIARRRSKMLTQA